MVNVEKIVRIFMLLFSVMIIVCAIFEIECPHQNIKKANFIHSCNRLFKLNLAHKTPAQAKTSDTELMGAANDIRTHSSSRKIKHFLVVAHSTLRYSALYFARHRKVFTSRKGKCLKGRRKGSMKRLNALITWFHLLRNDINLRITHKFRKLQRKCSGKCRVDWWEPIDGVGRPVD